MTDLPKALKITPHCHKADDTITLDETDRHRRRVVMTSDKGLRFLLDLNEARLLRHGEGLVLEDGREIEVIAKPEKLYEVRGRDALHLLKLTWQLGNRHLQTQVFRDHLIIRQDKVIKTMLEGLGADVHEITASFNPEGGAYDHGTHNHEKPHEHHHD